MSTSNRVDLQPVGSLCFLCSPAASIAEVHWSVSDGEYFAELCSVSSLCRHSGRKKMNILSHDQNRDDARDLNQEINPLILEHFTPLVQYFVWTYLECYENWIGFQKHHIFRCICSPR